MSAVSAIAARRAKARALAQAQEQAQEQARQQEQQQEKTKKQPKPSKTRPSGATAAEQPAKSRGSGEPPLKKLRTTTGSARATDAAPDAPAATRAGRTKRASVASQPSQTVETDDYTSAVEISAGDDDDEEDDAGSEGAWESDRDPAAVAETVSFANTAGPPTPFTPTVQDFLLSKHKLRKKDIMQATRTGVCLRLGLHDSLAVIGQYDLWVKRGVVSLCGAKLHPSLRLHRMFAPSTHSLPIIKVVATAGEYAEIELRSVAEENGPYGLKRVCPLFDRIGAAEEGPGRSHAMYGLGPYSFFILHASSEDPLGRSLRPLHVHREWSHAIQFLSKQSPNLRVMACGPKGSGKSTFNTFLLNHLLSPVPPTSSSTSLANDPASDGVAFLDLDPGQPEFSPMGHVYLAHVRQPVFGPPYTHPSAPYASGQDTAQHPVTIRKATFIGSNSPRDDPDYYIAAAENLMRHYAVLQQSYPRCPLVVNYPGWIFGMGLEIATLFLRVLRLTDLVYMSERGPAEVIEPLERAVHSSQAHIRLIVLPSQPTDFVSRSSAQLRAMQMVSYYHCEGRQQQEEERRTEQGRPDSVTLAPRWSDEPLICAQPYRVSYAGDHAGIAGVMVTGSTDYDMDLLKELLEGSIVGIVATEEVSIANPSPPDSDDADTPMLQDETDSGHPTVTTNRDGIPYLRRSRASHRTAGLDPSTSRALGLALIHSIDVAKRQFILYTPVPLSLIRSAVEEQGHAIVLVKGHIDTPHWAVTEPYFAARATQGTHRRAVAVARGRSHRAGDGESDDDAAAAGAMASSHRAMTLLRERVRLAGRAPWMRVTAHDAGGGRSDRDREKMFLLRKKPQVVAGDSDAE